MSGKVIQCFNEQECTYEKCPVFSPEIDTCKMELFKGTHVKAVKFTEPEKQEPEPASEVPVGARPINTLKEGETGSKANPITIKGTAKYDAEQKDVDTRSGPSTVTSIVVEDDSGEAKLSFWGDAHGQVAEFKKGDKLFFEGLYKVKAPYKDTVQIDGGKYYKVVKLN